eukprot:CAMPEP_0206219768 /NCGR_PEP_ID=MMETSP0047_2-20121206/4490_1 /ASSEMBLY_ACC=CAM_ASM_000192 /TAXON_ID=195065 /ORGANISM="Chroomonas mesostigmatica_cf, Strain CCMP1168" /LENGTH=123 /DNA_ID=CAMNT_0053642323 /DNA_START=230 /DNA_END=600 /DNA_ORIENTATION=+
MAPSARWQAPSASRSPEAALGGRLVVVWVGGALARLSRAHVHETASSVVSPHRSRLAAPRLPPSVSGVASVVTPWGRGLAEAWCVGTVHAALLHRHPPVPASRTGPQGGAPPAAPGPPAGSIT